METTILNPNNRENNKANEINIEATVENAAKISSPVATPSPAAAARKQSSGAVKNVAAAVGATGAGVAAGVVVGSVLSDSAEAATPEKPVFEDEHNHQPAHQPAHHTTPTPEIHDQPSMSEYVDELDVNTVSLEEGADTRNIEVMDYQTVENEDGSLSDIAVLSVDGDPMLIADVDRDGVADFAVADFNGDGEIQDNEVIDLHDENIYMAMDDFKPEQEQNGGCESGVNLVDYQTVQNEDGTLSDFAVVNVDGDDVFVADLDRDGVADYMASDINHNGVIEEDEIVDLHASGDYLAMEDVRNLGEDIPDDNGVHVVDYETVYHEDGSSMDIATLDVEGDTMLLIDVDRDGIADVLAGDFNGDGELQDDEIIDLQGEGEYFAMSDFRPENVDNPMASNDYDDIQPMGEDPDYFNEANVDDFMA